MKPSDADGARDGNHDTEPRRGTPETKLDEDEFRRRFLSQFGDPAFGELSAELDHIASAGHPSKLICATPGRNESTNRS